MSQSEPGTTTFSWLHLTDLHLGMAEQASLFPALKDRFFEDLKPLHEKCGPWDLVLFTGDLTQRGTEFSAVDAFLTELWERLEPLGSRPSLLAVPGNHDLARPNSKAPEVVLLCDWVTKPEVRTEFWDDPNSPYRKTVRTAFQNYIDWWTKTPIKKLPIQSGMLPGDFSATFQKDEAALGIVGLNTTFLQLTAGDYKSKLALNALQFHNVCDGDGPKWVKKHNACLLLTHQPPDWLSSESEDQLRGNIAGYFDVHLFGHMHESHYKSTAEGGAAAYRTSQGMALFGMEYFGEEQKAARLHGYAAGKINLQGAQGSFVLWPRKGTRTNSGQWNFAASSDFFLTDDHMKPEVFDLRKSLTQPPPASPDEVYDGPTAEAVASPFRRRWAVLVGVNDYKYFAKLHYCRNDVVELARSFREFLKFDSVFEFHEESHLSPRRDLIFNKLAELQAPKIDPDDLLVFYFSGHGIILGSQDYLLPIEASPAAAKNVGIKVDDLVVALQDTGCKNITMFIDACREPVEGAKGVDAIGEESKAAISKAGIVAFFSCDPKDRSYEIEPLKHGSFSYCILNAIKTGSATTVSQLDNYLREHVPLINDEYGKPTQQPYTVVEPAARGELEILFNPSRRLQAAMVFDTYSGEFWNRYSANEISEEIFFEVGQFISKVKDKKQLDAIDDKKLGMIKALCDGSRSVEDFSWAWRAAKLGSREPAKIKKLAPLT